MTQRLTRVGFSSLICSVAININFFSLLDIENTITTDREAGIEDDACSRGKNLSIVYEDDPRHECNDEDDDSDSPSNNESECEPKKPKRTRTAFTAHQLDQLELYFALSAYPDAFTRDDISRRLNIKEDRIQVTSTPPLKATSPLKVMPHFLILIFPNYSIVKMKLIIKHVGIIQC